MKHIIHACPKRMWYVREFLIPCLEEQGISDNEISVWNDDKGMGNLKSFIASCEYYGGLSEHGGAWHIQDDVLLCSEYKKKTEALTDGCKDEDIIVCGFLSKEDRAAYESHSTIGRTQKLARGTYIPYSFQCIYVPNRLLKGFKPYLEEKVLREGKYLRYYNENKYDDYLFYRYLHAKASAGGLNLHVCNQSLVEHIGHLLGGSIVNQDKGTLWVSCNFEDDVATEKLAQFIRNKNEQRKQ